jgi:hypothetical protein
MRRSLILATVLGCGLSTACGDSTGPGGIFGTYTLVSINGENLPVTRQILDTEVEYTAGSLRLDIDNTYTLSLTITVEGTTDTVDARGTFTVDGSTIEFSDLGTGTVSGDTLTINMWVYRK